MRQRSSRPDASPHASLARWRRYAPDGRRLLVLFSCFGVLTGLSVAVRMHLLASASPCHAGELYVERVIGGWKETRPQNPFGLCIQKEEIRNDLVRDPNWRDQLTAFFRTPEARAAGGATYYVATTGDDQRSCSEAQNINTPRQTIRGGAQCLSPGDTLLVRGGTYALPPGTSPQDYGCFICGLPSGTSWENATTVKGYPGERPIISGPNTQPHNPTYVYGIALNNSYVIIENFIIEWVGEGIATGGGDHVRIKDIEVRTVQGNGVSGGADYAEYINLNVHDWGQQMDFRCGSCDHGIYYGGDNTLIEGGEWHNGLGYGIHLRDPGGSHDNAVIRSIVTHNNRECGAVLVGGSGHLMYNNIMYENNGCGILPSYITSNKFYNNTIVNNKGGGIDFNTPASNVEVRNNIIYGNQGEAIHIEAGSDITQSNNLFTDPKFVNPSQGDFHLQQGSPAINAGIDLSAAGVTTDFDGIRRPQGAAFDIGAYEYHTGITPLPGDLNGDGKRDLADVRLLIYMLLGQEPTTPEADLTGDGAVTLADVQALIRLMVGLP